jgi:uridine monophosphate synthetase
MSEALIKELIQSNCIKTGKFTLKNGDTSKYYYDLKNIISNPSLIKQIGDKLYNILDDFDIICGVPYGGLPIALYISITYNKPMIYIRDKVKDYGTGKLIEGTYKKTDRCVVIDDVITSGKSLEDALLVLKDEINVVDVAVVLDRQQNYTCSKPVKAILYKNDITKYLLKQITKDKNCKLCFSADLEDPIKLLELLNKIGKDIVICKIHYDIINIDKYEGNFISDLIECSIKYNFLIMEDRKFVDISYIINKQYAKFYNWADLVTVHGSIADTAISNMSGVLLLANMSNNNYNLTDQVIAIAKANPNNVIGFITQYRINHEDLVCMTPGIAQRNLQIQDQKYKTAKEVDTDYIIVGRALYNSEDIENEVKKYIT